MYTWDLWYPNAAAHGLPFARAKVDIADVVLVHAAPDVLHIEVRDDNDTIVASCDELRRTGEYFPMTRVWREAHGFVREDAWPVESDIGRVVLLAGGEAGVLQRWWNAPDGSEWRWSVEFYNHR